MASKKEKLLHWHFFEIEKSANNHNQKLERDEQQI